jgi:hypothetical protein
MKKRIDAIDGSDPTYTSLRRIPLLLNASLELANKPK